MPSATGPLPNPQRYKAFSQLKLRIHSKSLDANHLICFTTSKWTKVRSLATFIHQKLFVIIPCSRKGRVTTSLTEWCYQEALNIMPNWKKNLAVRTSSAIPNNKLWQCQHRIKTSYWGWEMRATRHKRSSSSKSGPCSCKVVSSRTYTRRPWTPFRETWMSLRQLRRTERLLKKELKTIRKYFFRWSQLRKLDMAQ